MDHRRKEYWFKFIESLRGKHYKDWNFIGLERFKVIIISQPNAYFFTATTCEKTSLLYMLIDLTLKKRTCCCIVLLYMDVKLHELDEVDAKCKGIGFDVREMKNFL